jgi:DNA-directed RNA polymerase specialized sigma24 family protein
MRYSQGLDSTSIGKALSLKATTVRQTLIRIRELLRKCLDSDAGSGGVPEASR